MIDDAIEQAELAETVLEEDEALGLRILLGLHPSYRSEASPVIRRREASEYLVPAWRDDPPRDRAGSFQRRHQNRALGLALTCLRRAYGQEARSHHRQTDLIEERRWYYVAANRQIVRLRSEATVRIREDGLESYPFTEPRNDEPGVLATRFHLREHPIGPPLTLGDISDVPTQPENRRVTVRFPRPYMAGETVGIAWEEEIDFGMEVGGRRRYVAAEAQSDNFNLELGVTFADDVELPEMVWWYTAPMSGEDPTLVGPQPDEVLQFDADRSASHRWPAYETERRISYGLQSVWGPRESHWPPYESRWLRE
jgi:hypothetical protein